MNHVYAYERKSSRRTTSMVSCRRAALLLVLLAAAAASSSAAAASSPAAAPAPSPDEAAGPDYGYVPGTETGPENWAKLSPRYALCDGSVPHRKQSPVDIVTNQTVPRPDPESLNRTYNAVEATLVNNGKDISMTFNGTAGTVVIAGKVFSLKKLVWHAPSEHTINGQSLPLELQLVHQNDAGETAIIATLYRVGAADSFYHQLKKELAELASDKCNYGVEDCRAALGVAHLRALQRRAGIYFRYMGSLTAPPCTENVYWNVLSRVRQISQEQLDLLAKPLPATANPNARPVQPLNGRVISVYDPPIGSLPTNN